jgi:hypothetical protein
MAPSPITDTDTDSATDVVGVVDVVDVAGLVGVTSEELMPPTVNVHGPRGKYPP